MEAAFSWQKLVRSLPCLEAIDRRVLPLFGRFRGVGGWLMALTAVVALWLWNWPLVLATLTGLLSMLLAHWAQQYRWENALWQRLWSRSNRQLTLSVCLGALATIATYFATVVWLAAENGWLAIGTILQGLGTLAAVLLLLRQTWHSSAQPANEMQMLSRLSTSDPLDRLIAIRQVTIWAKTVNPTLQAQVADCFRLMLQHESEAVLQTALLEGLQALMPDFLAPDCLGTGKSPVAIPLAPLTEAVALQVEVKQAIDVRKT